MGAWGDESAGRIRALMQRLSTGAQMSLLAFVALAAVILLWISSTMEQGFWQTFMQAVATGLLVSAAFGVAQALVTGHITFDLLRESVSSEVTQLKRDFSSDVNEIITRANTRFMPLNSFETTESPDSRFNELMNRDLLASNVYWFRGVSARYTATRLMLNRHGSLEVRAVLPDLADPHSLDARAEYLLRHEIEENITMPALREKIRQSVAVGLVGLFTARPWCGRIEVILTPTPLLDRVELFGPTVWVTLFSAVRHGTRFPETLRFSNSSYFYTMQEAECSQLRASARHFELPHKMNDREFMDVFEKITGHALEDGELATLKKQFLDFHAQYAPKLRGGRNDPATS